MISLIILFLAVLTAGSILGTFLIAIRELNAIDDIPAAWAKSQEPQQLGELMP